MAFNVADVRAVIILIIVAVLAELANIYNYIEVMYVFIIVFALLLVMFINKLYHREIKKDYVSRYDIIEVPDEPQSNNAEGDDDKEVRDEDTVQKYENAEEKVQTDGK